jgi:transaldolase/glucose-6-phosphate isomerase
MSPTKAGPTSPATTSNPLAQLAGQGQSVWLDYIQRSLLAGGELERLIRQDGLRGMTSNPAIFEKAITGSGDYAAELAGERARAATDPKAVYEKLAIADIQAACDAMRPVYDSTRRRDGYVSLEVSPYLAHDTQGTLEEARRLWTAVARPNLMIKVPATPAGIPAVEALIAEGTNVNVTLLFAVDAYVAVARAYAAGLARFAESGGDVARVASVASFFVSRIDSMVDKELDARIAGSADAAEKAALAKLLGRTAIANAKLAYVEHQRLIATPAWKALAARGAMVQRLLWASTSTKDARWRDVVYVEELIGPDTVNTIPPATYDAFRDHGRVARTLDRGLEEAKAELAALEARGISLRRVTDRLLEEGVALFAKAFDKLLAAVKAQGTPAPAKPGARQAFRLEAALPADLARAVDAALADWTTGRKVERLWAKDASLWTAADESRWLGWLGIAAEQQADLTRFAALAAEAREVRHVLLLGMGGSSLCPEVLARTFGPQPGAPELSILDSTDPAQVAATEARLDLARTLFVVASKSGSTLEPNIFKQHFFERVKALAGAERAGKQFLAITDPGSKVQKTAEAEGWGRICFGVPSIGGRYSALSDFGLVPAALAGIDVAKLLASAAAMGAECRRAPAENPGVVLGAILGCAALAGRDKLTIFASKGLESLGAWMEQLIAESTGKQGKAIVPVDRESLAAPAAYGADRVFCALELGGDDVSELERGLAALEAAGHPVVRIRVPARSDVAGEFFRWEIATAVAGSILGINPFDQPDVEASKVETKKLTAAYEEHGALPPEKPFWSGAGFELYADERNTREILCAAGASPDLAALLRAHLARARTGDYFGLLAYVHMRPEHERPLAAARHRVRDRKKLATCLGFGPRFLHSTGQAYKGGPASGIFLQVTCDDARDVPVPGQKYGFGLVKAAQARGDFAVLAERGRRALRVHLTRAAGPDVAAALESLARAIEQATG